jgi:hypothetical protein
MMNPDGADSVPQIFQPAWRASDFRAELATALPFPSKLGGSAQAL